MNRYSPEIISELRNSTKLKDIKPLKLDIAQFYAFMLQRCLNKSRPRIPRGSAKALTVFDMLETEDNNPLSVYIYPDIEYLPDGDITWSIRKYESN